MKGIPAMSKRGGKEYAQTSAGNTTNSSVSSKFSNRVGNAGVGQPSRSGNESAVSSKFTNGRGGKEYAMTMDNGSGYCKK